MMAPTPQLANTGKAMEEDDGLRSFDPNLGPRARNRTEQARSPEEREWVSIDRVVNPELYRIMKLERFGKKLSLIELSDEGIEDDDDGSVAQQAGGSASDTGSRKKVNIGGAVKAVVGRRGSVNARRASIKVSGGCFVNTAAAVG